MNPLLLEWLGYTASAIIAISMFIPSIIHLRWVNLIGAMLFCVYGMMIGSWPVALLNAVIVCTDVYYLLRIYTHVDSFEMLESQPSNPYLTRFLAYYMDDIRRHNPGFEFQPSPNTYTYMVLRNMTMVGIFIAQPNEAQDIEVRLDYVTVGYRDFKNGKFVHMWVANKFANQGYSRIVATSPNAFHSRYLRALGYKEQSNGQYALDMATLL